MNRTIAMRDSLEMTELIRDFVCMIDHYTDYINHCQDPALRQVLENQQRHMVDEYNHKLNIIKGQGLDTSSLAKPQAASVMRQGGMAGAGTIGTGAAGTGMTGMTSSVDTANIQFGTQTAQTQTPGSFQGAARTLNDQSISQGALLFHKCGAIRATNAALECTDTQLRNLAVNSARTCTDMAYELFRYMNSRGFYHVASVSATAPAWTQGTTTADFQGAQQNAAGMQQQGYPATQQSYTGTQQNYPGLQQRYWPGNQGGNYPGQQLS